MESLRLDRRLALGLSVAAAFSLTRRARAATPAMPVVVELFTSQGCSSCPPADAFMGELVGRSNVIGLSLNVDYWDYIGWRDTLASPANTKRQRDYARKRGDHRIYTPQMVINGRSHAVGSDRATVLRLIDEESRRSGRHAVPMVVSGMGQEIAVFVDTAPSDALRVESNILLVTLLHVVTVAIEKGENTGRQVSYYNVVRKIVPLGVWRGAPVSMMVPKESLLSNPHEGCVGLLQVAASGHIIGAASWGFKSRPS
jgi:hypothetical protein